MNQTLYLHFLEFFFGQVDSVDGEKNLDSERHRLQSLFTRAGAVQAPQRSFVIACKCDKRQGTAHRSLIRYAPLARSATPIRTLARSLTHSLRSS